MRRIAATVLELGTVLAAIVLGGRAGLILLLVAGSIVLALRRGRWFATRDGDGGAGWAALGGVAVGAAALGAAWLLSPALLDVTGRAVEWTTEPMVRGSPSIATTLMLVTVAMGLAAELVFRRWLLDRVAGLARARGQPLPVALAAGILAAALIEAAVAPAGAGPRLGVALASGGLGVIYVGAGGRLAGCLTARLTFELGAVLVQALRLTS